ncbi:hypothetical protein SJAV_12770 [Sulfurisphaera javensis]|uniref:Uncharacterized protein n=1 Tax=Sulfurisphaera javensis TaxID=2049879 RepID=A0AAT9GR03_9CREN
MQDNKRIIAEKISLNRILNYINKIFERYKCEKEYSFLENKEIFMFKSKYSIVEIIDKSINTDIFLLELNKINMFPYSLGEPILMITESGNVKPLLPLSRYLIKICKNKIVLNEKMSEIITYGKPITIVNKEIEEKHYLAINKYGEFIAYVTVKKENNKVKIIPELDIGWYLRKGG